MRRIVEMLIWHSVHKSNRPLISYLTILMVYVFICRKFEQSKWKITPSTCRSMWSQKFSRFKNNNKSCNSGENDLSAAFCIIKQKWMRLDFLSFLADDRNFCPPAFFVPFHIHDYCRVCAEANMSIWKPENSGELNSVCAGELREEALQAPTALWRSTFECALISGNAFTVCRHESMLAHRRNKAFSLECLMYSPCARMDSEGASSQVKFDFTPWNDEAFFCHTLYSMCRLEKLFPFQHHKSRCVSDYLGLM